MIYKSCAIDVAEREPARWVARISRIDGRTILAGRGFRNAFYDTIATTTDSELAFDRGSERARDQSPARLLRSEDRLCPAGLSHQRGGALLGFVTNLDQLSLHLRHLICLQ